MAITLSANYSKKLGLPKFSSHSFSACVEIELTDISQVESECRKLYELLQHSVDQEIQTIGFVPDQQYGTPGASHSNSRSLSQENGSNIRHMPRQSANADAWNCTAGQRGFIQRIVNENQLDKSEVEELAHQLFGIGVKQLDKMQASQLIEDLLAKAGKPSGQNRWRKPQSAAA
jgi:hypothetical protein